VVFMSRANSASLFGSGTPLNLARVSARPNPSVYGLRSSSSPTGYYPAYGKKPRRRTTRERVNVSTNLVEPIVNDDDYVPRPYVKVTYSTFDQANRPAYN